MLNRRHPRLDNYDYSRAGIYFITICSKEKKKIFSDIRFCPESADPVGRDDLGAPYTNLTRIGKIVDGYIRSIPDAYPNVDVDHYTVMPNHVHLLLTIQEGGAPGSSRPTMLVPRIISALKRFSNRDAGEQLWQNSYYDHIIREEADYVRHLRYIGENPAKWAEDEFYTEGTL